MRRPVPGPVPAATLGYAALLDEVDGIRLVSPERLRELSAVAVDDIDQVMGGRAQVTLGYAHGRLGADPSATPTTFGMQGVGGSYACADTATGTAFAVAKNRLTACLLYTSPSPRDRQKSRMPSSA